MRDGFDFKSPVNVRFSWVSDLLSQLALSEAAPLNKVTMASHPKKNVSKVPKMRRAETSREHDQSAGHDLV